MCFTVWPVNVVARRARPCGGVLSLLAGAG